MSLFYQMDVVEQEKRKFVRIKTELEGKILTANRDECYCKTINISCKGALIETNAKAKVNDKVVIDLEIINQLEAAVSRVDSKNQIALKFVSSSRKQEQIADKLTWIVNQNQFSELEERKHKREKLHNVNSVFAISPQHVYDCNIIDLSLSGAAIGCKEKPPVGTKVKLGQTLGKVIRKTKNGFTMEFNELIGDLSDVLPE